MFVFAEDYNSFKAGLSEASSSKGIWDGDGWHFYSMLKIKADKIAADKLRDVGRMVGMYTNYNRAAVAATEIIAAKHNIVCNILEHQGNVIHFFFPDLGQGKSAIIIEFGRLMNMMVESHVRKYYDDNVTQFHMAAEFGRSVLVHIASPEPTEASNSVVSLGPCANAPAKQMGESKENYPRPLWWRTDNDSVWNCDDCSNYDEIEANALVIALEKYGSGYFREIPSEADDLAKACVESLGDVPKSTENDPVPIEGFFFRVDMDGFTNKIKSAFDSGRETIRNVVKEFVEYMDAANAWQISTDMMVSAFPWSGDCFSALVLPSGNKGWIGGFEMTRKAQPLKIVSEWERQISARHKETQWVYTVSGGEIYQFEVESRNRKFKLAVGRPAGLTLAAIHFNNNPSGSVVMHMQDISHMDETTRGAFKHFPMGRHPSFKFLSKEDRDGLGRKASIAVASKAFPRDGYAESRPWSI